MIGIIGAMKIEISAIRELMQDTETKALGGIEFVSGTLHGRQIVTAVCGIGKVAAAMCAQAMILGYSPELIVNTGVGGTLTKDLSVGDIAVAESVVQHDMDTSPLGDEVGFISGINVINIPCDAKAVAKLIECAADFEDVKTLKGVIASGDQFIADAGKKDFIAGNFSAIACEMEGAAIGQVCYTNGVPFAVVRAISDSADEEAHMSYAQFLPAAAANAAKMIEFMVNTC